jgi:hypothetical protein
MTNADLDNEIEKLLNDIHGDAFPDRMKLSGAQVRERERQLVRDFLRKATQPDA